MTSLPRGLSELADQYEALLCDVWGVIHNGRESFPQACDALVRWKAERGRMFDTPCYRWIPARTRVQVEYWIVSQLCERIPDSLAWPGANS